MPQRNPTEDDYLTMLNRVRGGVVAPGKSIGRGPVDALPQATVEPCRSRVGNPAPSPFAPYRSKLEAAFSFKLGLEKRQGFIKDYFYEPFSFKLANGKRYRVDFLRWNIDGTTDCLEIKGWHANRRDSLTHLAWAAQRFPFHRWLLCTYRDGDWDEKEILR